MKLESLGEFGLIDRIAEKVSVGKGVVTGIGDDCAVTRLSPGMQLLTSTDMLLENVHFRRAWHDPYRLGRKSLAVNISDIAAMGGIPRWALLSLAIPSDYPLEHIDDFTNGFLSMAAEHGVALIGGDTCASKAGLAISVTIMGEQLPQFVVRRDGARAGDDIWVTGTLGGAALGLSLLESGFDLLRLRSAQAAQPAFDSAQSANNFLNTAERCLSGVEGNNADDSDYLLSRLLDPTPRTSAGRMLAESGLVSAMIDVSDGLLSDYGHIAELSGVGGILKLDALPCSDQFRAAVEHRPLFPFDLLLSGGEDYELVFTAAAESRQNISNLMKNSGIPAVPVGIVTSLPGITVLRPDGTHYILQKQGFNHFK